MINETQRQQYLEAVGIDSYMPRWLLPLAPEPCRCLAPQPADADAVADKPVMAVDSVVSLPEVEGELEVVEAPVSSPAVKVGRPPGESAITAIQLLEEVPETSAEAESQGAAQVVAAPSAEAEEVSFALGLWRISEDLLVVDSRQSELALPVDALLSNILTALGYPRAPLPKLEVVRWPYGGNAFSDKSALAARHMMEAMLGAKLEQQPVKHLLLLGSAACHYLMPEGAEGAGVDAQASFEALLGKSVRLESWNCSAIIAPSLVDMLQQPELKAVAWSALQPLRRS